MTPAACLSVAELRAFLEGALSDDDELRVSEHLSSCEVCDREALAISDESGARDLLARRRASAATGAPVGSIRDFAQRLGALAMLETIEDESALENDHATGSADETHAEESVIGSDGPPRGLGKFEIVRELGAGGFGIVYLATDTVLRRLVALKLPRGNLLADPDLRRRFYREAEALARLDHPNIVPVYEAGEQDGTCYLAVGYCDGPTLDAWQLGQGGRVEPRLAARIMLALADAVEHAHAQGILHRDIKPGNILLDGVLEGADAASRRQLVPKLTDFGLARITQGQSSAATFHGMV